MEIKHIYGNAFYIDAPVKLGLLINDAREALLVDTGIDDSVGRKVKRLLEEKGYGLKGIFITHHHADHTGGAPFLVRTTGARVYAGETEKGFIEYPLTEPLYLFGGASPPPSLRDKFFMAPGVKVDVAVVPGMGLPEWECEAVDLAGHSMGQLGLLTGDGILYAADAVIGPEYIAKHGVPLNTDIQLTLDTYQRMTNINPAWLLPGHGDLTNDVQNLIGLNRNRVEEICTIVQSESAARHREEDLLAAVAGRTNMPINNQGQYALARLSVAAYLAFLQQNGHLTVEYRDGKQLWYPV